MWQLCLGGVAADNCAIRTSIYTGIAQTTFVYAAEDRFSSADFSASILSAEEYFNLDVKTERFHRAIYCDRCDILDSDP